MIYNESKQLSEAYKKLPLGVTILDYSKVKAVIDRLIKEGVLDLERYLKDNPDVLYNMVLSTETVDVNDRALRILRVDSLQEYSNLEMNFLDYEESDWENFYLEQFVGLANGQSHSRGYKELTADGTHIETKGNVWVQSGHEDDWKIVIWAHEDITKTVGIKRELIAAHRELQQFHERVTKELDLATSMQKSLIPTQQEIELVECRYGIQLVAHFNSSSVVSISSGVNT